MKNTFSLVLALMSGFFISVTVFANDNSLPSSHPYEGIIDNIEMRMNTNTTQWPFYALLRVMRSQLLPYNANIIADYHLTDSSQIINIDLENNTFRQVLNETIKQIGGFITYSDHAMIISKKKVYLSKFFKGSRTSKENDEKILKKLKSIRIPQFLTAYTTLQSVAKFLTIRTAELDSDGKGILVRVETAKAIEENKNSPVKDQFLSHHEHEESSITIGEIRDVPMIEIISFICLLSEASYQIDENGVVISKTVKK